MKNRPPLGIELPVFVQLEREKKHEAIYRTLRQLICDGTLRPGVRLPSTRDLARQWATSRGILDSAYDALRQEGYLKSRVGSGSWVCDTLPDESTQIQKLPFDEEEHRSPKYLLEAPRAFQVPFMARLADPNLFPMNDWRDAARRSLLKATNATLSEEDPAGHLPLRIQIASYLGLARGIRCTADDIIVTTGIRHGIDLAALYNASQFRRVLIEDPGYPAAYAMFGARGNVISSIPLDSEGIQVDALYAYPDAGMAYVTPAHQSPIGVTLSTNRRKALLDWAAFADSYIFEDDYDSEINYLRAPLPSLKAEDHRDRVIYCGSFNKTLLPNLRIGYLVVPKILRHTLGRMRGDTGRANSIFDQITLSDFIETGAFARHLRRVRSVYLRRRDIVIDTLRCALGERLNVSGEQAGFHFILWLQKSKNLHSIKSSLDQLEIHVQFVSEFSHGSCSYPEGIVIGFTAIDDVVLREAAVLLGRILRR